MALTKVVVLVGGVGGAKLAHGLAQILPPEQLTVVVNTGDDFWHYGLRVCPDLDTVMYTLSGIVDKANGWGVAGDSTALLDALRRYGEAPWFRLGDQDVATHLLRTQALRAGATITQVQGDLCKRQGIQAAILPMTDAEVSTMIDTVEFGALEFQDYFVRHRWQPVARGLRYRGIESASVTPEVRAALETADVILIGPSNPWLSIAPILAVPGMRDLLLSRDVPRVALSPIVGGKAIKGPAAKLMSELGYQVTAAAVCEYYGEILNGFVYDESDAELQIPARYATIMNTIMMTDTDRAALARAILNWVESWRS